MRRTPGNENSLLGGVALSDTLLRVLRHHPAVVAWLAAERGVRVRAA